MTGQSSYTLSTQYHTISYGMVKIDERSHLANEHMLNKLVEQLKIKNIENIEYKDHIKVIMPYFGDNAGKLGLDFAGNGAGYQEYVESIFKYRLLFKDIFLYIIIGDQTVPGNFNIPFQTYQAIATPLKGIDCEVKLENYNIPEPEPYKPHRPPHGGML